MKIENTKQDKLGCRKQVSQQVSKSVNERTSQLFMDDSYVHNVHQISLSIQYYGLDSKRSMGSCQFKELERR